MVVFMPSWCKTVRSNTILLNNAVGIRFLFGNILRPDILMAESVSKPWIRFTPIIHIIWCLILSILVTKLSTKDRQVLV